MISFLEESLVSATTEEATVFFCLNHHHCFPYTQRICLCDLFVTFCCHANTVGSLSQSLYLRHVPPIPFLMQSPFVTSKRNQKTNQQIIILLSCRLNRRNCTAPAGTCVRRPRHLVPPRPDHCCRNQSLKWHYEMPTGAGIDHGIGSTYPLGTVTYLKLAHSCRYVLLTAGTYPSIMVTVKREH